MQEEQEADNGTEVLKAKNALRLPCPEFRVLRLPAANFCEDGRNGKANDSAKMSPGLRESR